MLAILMEMIEDLIVNQNSVEINEIQLAVYLVRKPQTTPDIISDFPHIPEINVDYDCTDW